MERELLRTGLSGSALPAWLVRHDLVDRTALPSLLDGLAQWLGWTEAIALSASLNTATPAATRAPGPQVLAQRFDRVHQALRRAIDSDEAAPPPVRRGRVAEPVAADEGFAPHRQRYVGLQQTMESAISALRAQARTAVARQSPRLAAVDAVMEDMMATHEQLLLARLPMLLETHFERLRRAHDDRAWIPRFQADLQQLATAELQLRLQPVRGLIDSLRPR
jgi:Protein of unknown function (DUF3348)